MERISIFNYEAFYLDFLEGNLSEEDTRMLMEFFETHPECQLEVEEVVTLEDGNQYTFSNKSSLKQVDETGEITRDNIEHFMIAEAEGILNRDKSNELLGFIGSDEVLIAAKKRYDSVYFQADEKLVYQNKKGLKRKTLVLWPYVSVAAAAAVIAFVFFTNAPQAKLSDTNFALSSWIPNVPSNQILDSNNQIPQVTVVEDVVALSDFDKGVSKESKGIKYNVSDPQVSEMMSTSPLKHKPIPSLTSFDSKELVPVSTYHAQNHAGNQSVIPANLDRPVRNDVAMNNPIKPITNFVSEKANTEIDFGKRKATETKKGGFYVKVGSFELSRNRN